MSDLESRNTHSRKSGNETDREMARLEERKAIKEELNDVREQINRLHDKLERTIYKNGLLLTLNYRLIEELETANTPSTQDYKAFELRQKAELHQEIAELAILNKVTKADHEVYKDSILSWLPALMQHQKSMEKDFKQKVSAKDSGVEIGDDDDYTNLPKASGDTQVPTQVLTKVPTADNKASKNEVNQLKEQPKDDQQIWEGLLQVNAEMLIEEEADSGPIDNTQDQITSEQTGDSQEGQEIAEDDAEIQFSTASGATVVQQGALDPDEAESDMQFQEEMETYAEEHVETTYEAQFDAAEEQEEMYSETQCQEEVAQSESVMQPDRAVDACQDHKLVAEATDQTKNEALTVKVEEAIDREIAIQDGSQSTGEEIVVENVANEQDTQKEPVEQVTEHRSQVTDDHPSMLQNDKTISDLKDDSACLQNVNKDTS